MAKILIVRLGAMGDILHALPAVTGIRAALPEAAIGWIVEKRWAELLAAEGADCIPGAVDRQRPVVNIVHAVDTKRWRGRFWSPSTAAEVLAALRPVRKIHYDIALDFQGSLKSAFFVAGSGAPVKSGFLDPRESAARFFYSQKISRPSGHVIEQNHALAAESLKKFLGPRELNLLAPGLPYSPAAEAWAEATIKDLGIASFMLVNPGAGWGAKRWPAVRYGEVAQALAVHGLKTLVNAAPGEEDMAQAIVQASNGQAFAVACTIGQLLALSRRARLFMGGDTGPLHLAAALGVPVVALFGPTDPARTGPFGTRALALRHPESQTTSSHRQEAEPGLLKIGVEEAVSAARRLLGSSHA